MNTRPKLRLIKGGAPDPLWEKLKSLGGRESDTYARVLVSYEWNDLKKGEYALVHENVLNDEVFLKLTNGKRSDPFDPSLKEFEIVWKEGKPL